MSQDTKRRTHHVTLSVKLATNFMARLIGGEEGLGPKPKWENFIWFDDIVPTTVWVYSDKPFQQYRYIRRDVRFYMKDVCLGCVELLGRHDPRSQERVWAIKAALYYVTSNSEKPVFTPLPVTDFYRTDGTTVPLTEAFI